MNRTTSFPFTSLSMNWSMDIALFLVGATDRFLARAD
jgi:hypothetical protein